MSGPAFLFDLDGTLMDSVYHHVLAWQEALAQDGIRLSVWRIHRPIGISGGLLANAMLRETGCPVTADDADRLRRFHAEAYAERLKHVLPLPGSVDLLAPLTELDVPWSIDTSGYIESAARPAWTKNLHAKHVAGLSLPTNASRTARSSSHKGTHVPNAGTCRVLKAPHQGLFAS
jgi:beta-phosphoglucomutase-like phosphatase (HAD superfamily)